MQMDISSFVPSATTTGTILKEYIVLQILSAAVQSLPPAKENQVWYGAFLNFLSILSADFKSFQAVKGRGITGITVSASKTVTGSTSISPSA